MPSQPQPPPQQPQPNGSGLSTGEYNAVQTEALKENARRKPVTHWELTKANIAVVGTVAAIVLGLVTFGDRIVTRAESKTLDVMREHIEGEKQAHQSFREELKVIAVQREYDLRSDAEDKRALYQAILYRRPQSRFEREVEEPGPAERVGLGVGLGTGARDGGR